MNTSMATDEPEMDRIDEAALRDKLERLAKAIRDLGSVVVCFSGGLDSGLVLAVAVAELGDRAVALTATGPALAPAELEEAIAFARERGSRHVLRDAGELQSPGYVANGPDRCFHCKTSLYVTARAVAQELGLAAIANGTNLDDLGDYRPGLDAARQAGVSSPLLEQGLCKRDVRAAARLLGLQLWDKPAAACLASRLPYGTEVTSERLAQIAGFEAEIRAMGIRQARVRHHGAIARIEVAVSDIERMATGPMRETLVASGKRHGFTYVVLDLGGYRVGSHNEMLDGRRLRTFP